MLAAARQHGPACVAFLILAGLVTAPLWTAPGTAIPGAGFGDNVGSLWNFWWAREALTRAGGSIWQTDALFAPIGTPLVLHTGTPLLTVAGALAAPASASPALLNNVFVALGLFLNGVCAYAAAFHTVRQRRAALLAGLIFALSPCLVARIDGHLNLLHAWGLPLIVLWVARLRDEPALARGALLGLTLGAIAYVDYYYFVFGMVLAPLLLASSLWRVTLAPTPLTRLRRWLVRGALPLAIGAGVIAVAIQLTGGGQLMLAGRRVSLTGTFNLRLGAWIAVVIAAWAWLAPRVRIARTEGTVDVRRLLAACAAAVGAAAVVLAPLVLEALRLIASDDYVSQHYRWRSAPGGIDLASLVLGNPRGALWASIPRAAYQGAGIDIVESAAWPGFVPGALLVLALVRLRRTATVRVWLVALAVFFVWSLGPFLTCWDTNTGLLLPQALARYVPLVNNARLPGRAFVGVVLMMSLIAAAAWRELGSARGPAFTLVVVLLLADYWPAPVPVVGLERPALDGALRRLPRGVVLELPLGMRDGFGEVGRPNHRAQYFQTLHGQPMAGGFVARLAPQTRAAYQADPVFGRLLALSADDAAAWRPGAAAGGAPAPASRGAGPSRLACAVRYVILDSSTPAAAHRLVLDTFELEPLTASPPRTLYRVRRLRGPSCIASGVASPRRRQ